MSLNDRLLPLDPRGHSADEELDGTNTGHRRRDETGRYLLLGLRPADADDDDDGRFTDLPGRLTKCIHYKAKDKKPLQAIRERIPE